jgi:hypothetical protein
MRLQILNASSDGGARLSRRIIDGERAGFRIQSETVFADQRDQLVARRLVMLAREEKMLNGIEVLGLAFGVLATLWIIVFYGSSYFGPKTD